MKRRRPEQRLDYYAFPEEYFAIIEQFRAHGHYSFTGLSLRECRALQRDVYRFFGFLRNAPIDDQVARQLAETADTMKCRYLATSAGPDGPIYTLEWYLNPIVKLVRSSSLRSDDATPRSYTDPQQEP